MRARPVVDADSQQALRIGERVNLEIFRAFEEQGIQFSLPFRVTHMSLDSEATPLEVKVIEGQRAS